MSTKKTSTTKPAGRAGKPSRAHSSNPGTAMRAHGHVLIQTWASKELQAAIREHAKKTKKYISDILREVIGREAEKWSGAATGSLQVLRKVKTGGKAAAGIAKAKAEAAKVLKAGAGVQSASKPAAKSAAKSASKSKSKQKVAKAPKSDGKVVVKSAKKASGKPSAARHGTNGAPEVAAAGAGAGSGTQGTQVET